MSNIMREHGLSLEKSAAGLADSASTVPSLCGGSKAPTPSVPSSKASTASQQHSPSQQCSSSASTVLSSRGENGASDNDAVRMKARRELWKLLHGSFPQGTNTNNVHDQEVIDRAYLIKVLRALEKDTHIRPVHKKAEKEDNCTFAGLEPLALDELSASMPTLTSCGSAASSLTSPSMQSIGSVPTPLNQPTIMRAVHSASRPTSHTALVHPPSWLARQTSQGCLSSAVRSPRALSPQGFAPLAAPVGPCMRFSSAPTASMVAAMTASAVAAATSSALAASAFGATSMQQIAPSQGVTPASTQLTTISTTATTSVATGGIITTSTTCVTVAAADRGCCIPIRF